MSLDERDDEELLLTDDEVPGAMTASWVPPETMPRHSGDPIEADMVFFAPPPPEIGPVISAETTLRAGKRPMGTPQRLLLMGMLGSAAMAALHFGGVPETWVQVIAFLVVAGLVWAFTGFRHAVSYVGQQGIARIACSGNTGRVTSTQQFLYADAAELRTSQTRHYTNGVYTGTQYSFKWTDAARKGVHSLSGSYNGEKKPPKPKDKFHYASRAEFAWSLYLLDAAQKELETTGQIRFPLGGADWVAVGPGRIVTCLKGVTEEWDAETTGGISADQGTFKIKRPDAKEKLFGSKGVVTFSYSNMANGQLFLIALERLVGVTF